MFTHSNSNTLFILQLCFNYCSKTRFILVHTQTRWKNIYDRDIKCEATPIIILKPFGPTEIVYEYADTENGRVSLVLKKRKDIIQFL